MVAFGKKLSETSGSRTAPPLDSETEYLDSSLIENTFVPVEPWDNYGDNFGTKANASANVVDFGPLSLNPPEPDPAPLVSYSTVSGPTQSVGPSDLVKRESSDLPSNKSDKTIDMGEAQVRLHLSKQIEKLPEPYKTEMKAHMKAHEKQQSKIRSRMEALALSEDGMKQKFLPDEDRKEWADKVDALIAKTLQETLGLIQKIKRNANARVPEKDPEVLREWLFENFENPYPTSEDKARLADLSGYTKKQATED